MPAWYGSVAKVTVNGKPAGYIWPPAVGVRRDRRRSSPASNTIEVVVIGTLKNTLGPHHAGPVLGTAWPAMFHQGPDTARRPARSTTPSATGCSSRWCLENTAEKGVLLLDNAILCISNKPYL